MQQHYELVYLLRLSVSETDAKEIETAIKALLQGKDAKIEKFGEIGKRKLAYDIDHETHANYWLVQFDADTQAIAELHRVLTLDGRILRFLIVSVKPKTQEDIEREQRMKERIEKDEMKKRHQEKEDARKEKMVQEQEQQKKAAPAPEVEKEKLSLDELDQKLDELLEDDSLSE